MAYLEVMSWMRVESPRVATALCLSPAPIYLAPFINGAKCVPEVARTVRETPQHVHYWVGRLLELGLLIETEPVPRRGRPLRQFQPTYDGFTIKAEHLPQQLFLRTSQALAARMASALEAAQPALVHDSDIEVTFPPEGGVNINRTQLQDHSANAVFTSMTLNLTQEQAGMLRGALWHLIKTANAMATAVPVSGLSAARSPHLIQIAVAPLNDS